MPVSRQLLKPVKLSFIVLTFLVGLVLDLVPWGPGMRQMLPDSIALLLLYWCMNQPSHVGVGWAFWLGLTLDLADGNTFGQHSLAYVASCYLVLSRHRQLAMFPLWQQAIYIAPLLLLNQAIMVAVRLVTGAPFPGWSYFVGPLIGMLAWPLLSYLLQIPQRKEKPAEL
ncbi:rod shape-determining protein MreD [Chitinimonas lacunae]|uniref:Rod shape-determining protein MreD n=1 Tax=Chitinimonas lacunae TaxID=1963018 RepID=A0ABV8MSW1_9NEIS